MKTIKLPTILLNIFLFLSGSFITVSAQSVSSDAKGSSFVMKALESKPQESKDNSQESSDARFAPKAFENADWTRKSYQQNYTQGKIQTH